MGRRTVGRAPAAGAAGVVLVLILAGYLFAANARLAGEGEGRQPQDLAALVRAEQERAAQTETEVAGLAREIEQLTDAQTGATPQDDPQAELTALVAGRTAVAGPGLTVRLTDAPANAPRPDWVTNDDLVVHQQDLQAVINALWAGGAEAMSLQDQRVISTSAFRCVGNVLFLHGRHYSPPFEVRAIGDPVQLRRALLADEAIQTYLDYVEVVGLGWSVTTEDRLDLPGYDAGVELEFARVPEDADGA